MSAAVSAGEQTVKVVAWATFFSASGLVVGSLVDNIVGAAIEKQTDSSVIRALVQFGVGIAVLGSAVDFVVPLGVQSPISDGLMFYWFLQSQPRLNKDVACILCQLRNKIFGKSASSDPHASSTKPCSSDKLTMPSRPVNDETCLDESKVPVSLGAAYDPSTSRVMLAQPF